MEKETKLQEEELQQEELQKEEPEQEVSQEAAKEEQEDVREEEKQTEIKQTETGYVVDWTKLYPILVTYQQEMDCAPYEAQFAAMIREVQKTYGYSAEDAMLALKDIFAKTYFKEFQP